MSSSQSPEGTAAEGSTREIEKEVKQLGLTELHAGKIPEADIIFVHGSGGSPRKTWVYKGNLRRDPVKKAHVGSVVDKLMARIKRGTREPVFWPADILPQDHQDVRILTYGYQSNERKFLSRSTNKLTIPQHGNQFLESIARARHNARGRPIIFVAHDRGGLIVKQAIVESKKQKKAKCPELHDIYESFQGVIFLGTPHRGPEDALRALPPTGMSKEVDFAKPSTIAKANRSKKPSKLNDLYNDFCDIIIEEEVIRVSNFQEAKRKARMLSTRKIMSDYFSTFGVRDWERTDVINSDRTNMCRFPNREDDGYDKVRNAIGFHLGTKRSKTDDGLPGELSLVDPSNADNMANWRESNSSTVIFDCNGLSHDFKERILQWLHRLAPSNSQIRLRNEKIRQLEDGTGNWFLGLEELDRWLNEPLRNKNSKVNRMLWFTGEPGVGKSILSCILIEHLEQISTAASFGFAWYICNFKEQQTGTSLSLSITWKLLQQLLKQETSLPANVFRIYKKYEKCDGEETELLEDECLELLKSVVEKFPKVYIVIDGLDELEQEARLHAIKTIEALLSSRAYCAITSRTGEPDIEHSFSQRSTRLKIGASEPDVWTYLENHISKPCPLANVIAPDGQSLKADVIATISRNSDDMMLLAQQNLKELSDENTLEGLEIAMTKLSNNLDDLYMDTWHRIKKNNSQKVFERVREVIMWVVFASRPLEVPELRHALAIRDDSEEFNHKALWDTPVDESSLGLIVIDEDQTVRLCHKSARAYFEAGSDYHFPNANETIAKTCLRYLLLNSLSPGDNPTIEDVARQAEMFPFHSYAFDNFHVHAKRQMTPDVRELIMRFIQDTSKITTSYQLSYYIDDPEDDICRTEFDGMQVISSFDLHEFIMPLQEFEVDLNSVECNGDHTLQSILEVDGEDELDDEKQIEKEEEEEGEEKHKDEEETEEEIEEESKQVVIDEPALAPQGAEEYFNTPENDVNAPSQSMEEHAGAEVEEDRDSEKNAENQDNKNKNEESEKQEEQQTMEEANEPIGSDAGEDTVIIHHESPAETADVQKTIRDFLVREGKISAREDHDGTHTPENGSSKGQSSPNELSDDGNVSEGSKADSVEKHTWSPQHQTANSSLNGTVKIPFHHDGTRPSDTRTALSLIAEHRLSTPHMRTTTPNFKLPSMLTGKRYGTPSSSVKDRLGGLPLYLTPMGEREDLVTKQYSSHSLPGRKGRGAKTRSTSDSYDLDGVLTLPKRNMYLYPAARDRYDSMFHTGRTG